MARLAGVSVSSARRYLAGRRAAPDAVAVRFGFLALIVGGLVGSYDEVGVRRWFHRPREMLNGRTPAELLDGDWNPDDEGPRRVRELVAAHGPSPAELEERHGAGYRKAPPVQQEFKIPERDHAWGDDAWEDE